MTTTPAMPELPEPYTLSRGDEDGPIQLGYTADQMRAYALATLQAQPAEVSDAELRKTIDALRDPGTVSAFYNGYYTLTPDELRRAILALRQQSESDARKAAQEQLYAERERHTAVVSDERGLLQELIDAYDAMSPSFDAEAWTERARATLALRPQAVPMTDEQAAKIMFDLNNSRTSGTRCWGWIDVIRAVEAYHGITAPAGGEGEA